MNKGKRRTVAQIIKNAVPHMTVEERLAALESMVQLLVTKHNGLARECEKRDDNHQHLIEALILDTADLQGHIHGPDPELENHPDFQALRRKHFAENPARASANIIDLAKYRTDGD
jgi:hypothetical protein